MDAQSSLQYQNKVRRLGRLSSWNPPYADVHKATYSFVGRRVKNHVCVSRVCWALPRLVNLQVLLDGARGLAIYLAEDARVPGEGLR